MTDTVFSEYNQTTVNHTKATAGYITLFTLSNNGVTGSTINGNETGIPASIVH